MLTADKLVHLDDLIDSVLFFLRSGAPSRIALDIVGPKRWRFEDIVRVFRQWMRWPRPPSVNVPAWASRLLYGSGDIARAFGWRTPITSTARREMARGAEGDSAPWQQVTGIAPRDLEESLMREPASV